MAVGLLPLTLPANDAFPVQPPGPCRACAWSERRPVIAYWYAYDDEGDNKWLLGDSDYDGDELVFEVFEADGEGFPPNYDPATHELDPWGEMTLALDRCRAGTLSWTTSSTGFEDGTMPLLRISPANAMPCFDEDLGNVDTDSDEAVEGPLYLLDFRVRGR